MSRAFRAHSLRNRHVSPAALDPNLIGAMAGLLVQGKPECTVVPLIQRKPHVHTPGLKENAEGKFRPACGTGNCLDDYASNLPWQDDADEMLDYAASLLEEADNGPRDDDPRHSDVTRGWAVSA